MIYINATRHVRRKMKRRPKENWKRTKKRKNERLVEVGQTVVLHRKPLRDARKRESRRAAEQDSHRSRELESWRDEPLDNWTFYLLIITFVHLHLAILTPFHTQCLIEFQRTYARQYVYYQLIPIGKAPSTIGTYQKNVSYNPCRYLLIFNYCIVQMYKQHLTIFLLLDFRRESKTLRHSEYLRFFTS